MNKQEIDALKARDAFFTNPEIAKGFVDKVETLYPFKNYDTVLEPSAGNGAILQFLPETKRVGLDIEPMTKEILPGDFFDYTPPKGKTIVVGNPPFGKQSKTAIQFFNKCAEFADVIAFIIPRSWMKFRTQNQLHKEFGLYSSITLPDKAFLLGGEEYVVRCCAQIWGRYKPTGKGTGGYESWNEKVSQEMLDDIDAYQEKHGCYDEEPNLWGYAKPKSKK